MERCFAHFILALITLMGSACQLDTRKWVKKEENRQRGGQEEWREMGRGVRERKTEKRKREVWKRREE